MRRHEGIHPRHSQGDARKEGGFRRLRVENKNTHEHTVALAIRIADQVRDARPALDTLSHGQRREAQSRVLGRGIRFGR